MTIVAILSTILQAGNPIISATSQLLVNMDMRIHIIIIGCLLSVIG